MKLKLFPLVFVLFSLALAKPAYAANTCQIANWYPESRNLQVCIGGFDTIDQINGTVANFNCIRNSNAEYYNLVGGCRDLTGGSYTMSGYTNCIGDPNCNVAVDAAGKYYTCLTGQAMSRGVGRVEVSFTKGGTNICTTNSVRTIPSDWDPLTEGKPWDQPGRTGTGAEMDCISGGQKGINTALGCIPTDFTGGGFVTALLRLAIGLGSGIALLLILYGIFVVTTSTGIPEKLNAGREVISSAIAGLLFIILSIFLLNLIGVKILAIPGL